MNILTRLVFCGCLLAAGLCGSACQAAAQAPPTASGKDTASLKAPGPMMDAPQEPTTLPTAWIWIGMVVLLAVAGALLWSAVDPQNCHIQRLGPSFFFWLGVLYLGLLLVVAGLYVTNCFGFKDVLEPIDTLVPLCVPWFGALGAVAISWQGVFDNNRHWDPTYNYWHIGRPLMGAVVGIVAYFLLQLTLAASGAQPQSPAVPRSTVFYCVVAFLVGYREEIFRDLLKQAVDLLLRPSPPPAPAPAVTFKVAGASPSAIDCGNVAVNTPKHVVVEVHNTGKAPLAQPHVAAATTAPVPGFFFQLDNDQVSGLAELAPGQSATVEVVFTPNAAGSFAGTLTVTGTNLSVPETIRVTGMGTPAGP